MARAALPILLLFSFLALTNLRPGPGPALASPAGQPAGAPWPAVTWERVLPGTAWWQDGLTCPSVLPPDTPPCRRITALVPDPVTPGILYLVEKSGRIYLVRRTPAGTLEPVEPGPGPAGGAIPWLDISDRVRSDARELGLYAMAFGPDGPGARTHFYLYYTRKPQLPGLSDSGAMVLARFPWSSHTVKPLPGQEAIMSGPGGPFVVHRPDVSPNCDASLQVTHSGGGMAWGHDGYLYLALGDGGCQKDEPNHAQNTDPASALSSNGRLFLGKLLRIAPSPTAPTWTVPPTNPVLPGMTAPTEIFATGLRNPWKLDRDPVTGNLFLADTGERALEEVNLMPFPPAPGRNYGWACYEGPVPTPNRSQNPVIAAPCPALAAPGARTDPVATFAHDACGNGAITGGVVYRSGANPAWQGLYVYANFLHVSIEPVDGSCAHFTPAGPAGQLFLLRQAAGGGFESTLAGLTGLAISAFGRDECGNVYFADFFSGDVYRLGGPDYVDPCTVPGFRAALPVLAREFRSGW